MADVQTRNLIFGIQDAAVTTLGIMAGISLSSVPRRFVIRLVLISVLVSSVSMGIGSYQSERVAQTFTEPNHKPNRKEMLIGALIMSASYFVMGCILMIPYFLTRDTKIVVGSAIIISATTLFIAGWFVADIAEGNTETVNEFANAIETMALGLIALFVGFASGKWSQFLEKAKYSRGPSKK